jgi:hypothetical protein
MKFSGAIVLAAMTATTLLYGAAGAQTPQTLPAQLYYYDDYEWPLPDEGTTTMALGGMKSVHAVSMTFSRYSDGKPVTDSAVFTLLEGSTMRWSAPQGGCTYVLQLVNGNQPAISMTKPTSMCSLRPGAKVIFKILATP